MSDRVMDGAQAIVLHYDVAREGERPLASCLGGLPPVPVGFTWPVHLELQEPLAFVGQINFGDFPLELTRACALPSEGLLQFFYRHPESLLRDGVEGESQREHRAFWYSDVNAVQWTAVAQAATINPTRFTLRSYSDMAAQTSTSPAHQLGGVPKRVQYSPFEAVLTHKESASGSWLRRWLRPASPQHPAARWRLLWQIDSDSKVGLNWIDGGTLFLLIKETALQQSQLANLHVNLQTA